MDQVDRTFYLSQNEYKQAIGVLRQFTKIALLWLTEKTSDQLKDQIIGNFIARGTVCLDSIYRLWQVGNYQDCWVLHRTLVDRVLHLRQLIDRDEFAEFERWSFQKQYQMADAALSDPMIIAKLQPEMIQKAKALHKERRSRFRQEPKSTWKRPRAKDVAKGIKLPIVYRIGYDYPSTEVHPMADDGKEEFAALLGLPLESYGDNRVILHNSLMMQFLLVQYGLGGCTVLWRGFVSDFLDQWFRFLESGSQEWLLKSQRVFQAGPDISWCELRTEEHSPHGQTDSEKTK